MSIPLSRHSRRWWKVIAYEVWMLRAMISIPANHPIRRDEQLANSVSENTVLHMRNLCDFCTSPNSGDIRPKDLVDNFPTDPRTGCFEGCSAVLIKNTGGAAREVRDGRSTRSWRIRQR
jgi:hypothetical protein